MDIEGGGSRLFVQGNTTSPSWSPDGNQLAVLDFHPTENGFFGVYLVDLNEDKPKRGRQIGDVIVEQMNSPSWFPDGVKIAVDGIQIVDVESGQSAFLMPARSLGENFARDVSPDGMRIVFTSNRSHADQQTFEIFVIDSDGNNSKQLSYDYDEAFTPSRSPDGCQIAFSSNRSGNREIHVMDADGKNIHNITNHPANDITPDWIPSLPVTPLSPVGKLPVLWSDVKRERR